VTFDVTQPDQPASLGLKLCFNDDCSDSAECDAPLSGGEQTVTFDSGAMAWLLYDASGQRQWKLKSDVTGWPAKAKTCNSINATKCQ
jgi:hypothetical protein